MYVHLRSRPPDDVPVGRFRRPLPWLPWPPWIWFWGGGRGGAPTPITTTNPPAGPFRAEWGSIGGGITTCCWATPCCWSRLLPPLLWCGLWPCRPWWLGCCWLCWCDCCCCWCSGSTPLLTLFIFGWTLGCCWLWWWCWCRRWCEFGCAWLCWTAPLTGWPPSSKSWQERNKQKNKKKYSLYYT